MRTRRDCTLVLLTALGAGGLAAMAQSDRKPAMNSTAIEWDSIQPRNNANGSSKKFFEGPSPTLGLLECHATTLRPGAMNHEILKRTHDEVIIVKEGTVEAYVGGKWVKLAANRVSSAARRGDGGAGRSPSRPAGTAHRRQYVYRCALLARWTNRCVVPNL